MDAVEVFGPQSLRGAEVSVLPASSSGASRKESLTLLPVLVYMKRAFPLGTARQPGSFPPRHQMWQAGLRVPACITHAICCDPRSVHMCTHPCVLQAFKFPCYRVAAALTMGRDSLLLAFYPWWVVFPWKLDFLLRQGQAATEHSHIFKRFHS